MLIISVKSKQYLYLHFNARTAGPNSTKFSTDPGMYSENVVLSLSSIRQATLFMTV